MVQFSFDSNAPVQFLEMHLCSSPYSGIERGLIQGPSSRRHPIRRPSRPSGDLLISGPCSYRPTAGIMRMTCHVFTREDDLRLAIRFSLVKGLRVVAVFAGSWTRMIAPVLPRRSVST